ncbi:S-layer homology domain-containing protein [Paenibacillus arenilitoris]|uniref:S-layer homology domain-containing protein n=1 Tax=Paenibacillus arenilitoris TaxID=2772299 RepID=A0A927CJ77_9BACL|nr:S-layer homology domain-containing protein [Paenibacillus arenilitoris]MBD2868509.1 S-layer homology domain-containing protein [Paenibacillus arenilitoris]
MKRMYGFLSVLLLFYTICSPAALAEEAAGKSVDQFTDLKHLPAEVKNKFDVLIKSGIFHGISDDRFGLDLKMNRAQMAKVASLIFELPVDYGLSASSFSDVAKEGPHGYALPYIEALKAAKMTKGSDAKGTLYNPSGEVGRQELATFLIRGLGLEDEALEAKPVDDRTVSQWARPYVALALENKLLANKYGGTAFEGAAPVTRYELALAAYEARNLFIAGKVPDKASIVNAHPTGAKEVTVWLNKEVDTGKAKLGVTRDGSDRPGDIEWASDKMTATITLDQKLTQGKYLVKLTGLDEEAVDRTEAEFTAQDERLAAFRFASSSDILPQAKVIIPFKAVNQYDEESDWTASDFRIEVGADKVRAVPLAGKQAFQLDLSRHTKGAPVSVILMPNPMTADTSPVSKLFTVGDPPIVSRVELGELKFLGSDKALKPGGRAYQLFSAFDQYGFRISDADLLNGERGITTAFSEPGVFRDNPSMGKLFDYDNDGYPDLSIEVSPDVKIGKEVSLMLFTRIYGQQTSVKLKVKAAQMPASVEFDFADTLTVGEEDVYIPIIVKDEEGVALSQSQIVDAETSGLLQVASSGQLVVEADPPFRTDYSVTPNVSRKAAIQANGTDRGKIRIARAAGAGQALVSVILPHTGKSAQLSVYVEEPQERVPASVKLDGDSSILLLPGKEQQVKFKILDQYGDQFNAALPDYKVEYKLERTAGEAGAVTTKGAAVLNDETAAVRIEMNDSSGKGVTFVADPAKTGSYRLSVSLIRVDSSGALIGILSSASAVAEVYGGSQTLTYEMELDDTLFAAGSYYYERKEITTVTDSTYLLASRDLFAREIEISAKDEQGRDVALPSGIIRQIGSSDPDVIGDDDVSRIIGLSAGKATVTVIFDTPTGARTLSKEVVVKDERPAIQEMKVDKSANVIDSSLPNGLLPWDERLMKKVTVTDQYGNSVANDKIAEYNDLFGISFLIGDIHYVPNTSPDKKDKIYIDDGNRIVYKPGSGNEDEPNMTDFTLTAVAPNGKTSSTFITVN